MNTNWFLTGLAIILFNMPSQAQQKKEINQKAQFWWSVNSTTRLSEKWGVIADFHTRRDDFVKDINFYFARAGFAFWASDKLTLVGGYAHLWLAQPITDVGFVYQNENRVYQQAQWRQKEGKVTFVHRIRNEQRWREALDPDGKVDGVRFADRIRFLFSIAIPVFENEYLPVLSIADEVHFQFGKSIVLNTFDQNRTFLGIKQKITQNLSFDLGYMMVYQQKSSGFEYDMNHTLRWFFYFSPDLRKLKKGPHYPIPGDE
jgi:hypothetical protein